MKQAELIQKYEQMLINRCTPEVIKNLEEHEIFVFGSDPHGPHQSDAEKIAVERFGANERISEGISGRSYAIPIHRHRTEIMSNAVSRLIEYARIHTELTFFVLPIGCGSANMDVAIVAKMFKEAVELGNVYLPAIFIKALKKDIIIPEDEQLPIKYIDKIINADCLRGRMMGLMAEISKRTEEPITFDDEILKKDNMFLFAFLRIAKIVKKEEQRVINTLMDEIKRMSETELGRESDNGTIRSLEFVRGWKLEANKIFEENGSIYDLLSFTNPQYIQSTQETINKKGSHEELKDGKLKVFSKNGKDGLKNHEDNVIIPAEYDTIDVAGYIGRGWHLKKGGKWGAVNARGEWMFDVEYDEIKTCSEGGHFLRKNGKMGFCNSKGIITIDFLYDKLEKPFYSFGIKAQIGNKWGCVDEKGNVVVPIEYDDVNLMDLDEYGMIKVKKDDKYGFYNIKDGLTIPIEYDEAYGFASSHPNETVVKKEQTWSVINTQNENVLPFEYDSISIDAPNVYRVKKNGLSGIINKEGKVLFPFKYKDLGAFDKNDITYAQNSNGLYGYIDKEDHLLIPFSYRYAQNFKDKYAEVSMEWNKVGIIDKNGKVVVPLQFCHVHIYWDDIVIVETDDRENHRYIRGLYDLKNGNILPCIYERINPRGRDNEGIMECECWKNRRDEPVIMKVNSNINNQVITTHQKYTYFIRLSHLPNGKLEIVDIRKETNTGSHPWQKASGTNYRGQIDSFEICREDNNYMWIKIDSINRILFLPQSIESENIIGFTHCGCWTDRSPIKGIVVPEGYKYIGGEAFMEHPTLEFVSLPNGLHKIEQAAFMHCPNLKYVFLGKFLSIIPFHPLSIIKDLAFDNCHPSLTFYIPSVYTSKLFSYNRNRFPRVESRELNEERIISSYNTSSSTNADITYGRIAIARNFAVVLEDNEWELKLIGHNPEFRQLRKKTRKKFIKLAAGFDGYMALADDGRIYVGPKAKGFKRGIEIEQLRDVVDVVGCEGHTVALHYNGCVTCIDEPSSYEGPEAFAEEVESWDKIIQVACGFDFVVGLKSDGTLVSAGRHYRCPNWKGIVQFDAFNCYYGNIYTIALLDNGRVVTDYTDKVSEWKDVVRVRTGNGYAIGLKADGTAYALGSNNFVEEVQSWRNIIEIECKFNHAVAILSNGSIVEVGF